jgi:hypothetical protein
MDPIKQSQLQDLLQALHSNKANHQLVIDYVKIMLEKTKNDMLRCRPEQLVPLQAEGIAYARILRTLTEPPLADRIQKLTPEQLKTV